MAEEPARDVTVDVEVEVEVDTDELEIERDDATLVEATYEANGVELAVEAEVKVDDESHGETDDATSDEPTGHEEYE
ncbi:MAG: hypothetical protein PPP55_02510 [Halorubrum sp.]